MSEVLLEDWTTTSWAKGRERRRGRGRGSVKRQFRGRREMMWALSTPHTSPLTSHPSLLTPHPLSLTRHPSPVTRHPSSLNPHPPSLIPHPPSLIPRPSSLIPSFDYSGVCRQSIFIFTSTASISATTNDYRVYMLYGEQLGYRSV